MASEDITDTESSGLVFFTKSASEKFTAKTFHSQFTSRLVSMRERERLTDVTLKCQNRRLTCHKVVLSAASSYFHERFCSTGAKESKEEVVELTSFSENILSTIVDFIYTAEITLSTDNVQSVCSACDELELTELKEGCDMFMSQRVEPANCLGLYVFAKQYNLELTLKESKDCMLKNLQDILRLALDPELKKLSEEELVEYISDDDLEVEDEAMVFEFVVKWIGVDAGSRKKSVERVMQHVRFPFCSLSRLSSDIKDSPLMQTVACKDLLLEAFIYLFNPGQRHTIASKRTNPRNRQGSNSQLLLFDGANNAKGKCWYFEEEKAQWTDLTNLPAANLCYFKACISGDEIIIAGGHISTYVDSVWAFNLLTKSWRSLPSLTVARYNHVFVGIGGVLYVTGGYNNSGVISQVEKLDAKQQGWIQVSPMRKELQRHVAVTLGQKIFVIGGSDKAGSSSLMTQVFDEQKGQWETKRDMPQTCNEGSAVVLHQKIYVVGDGSQCCMSYDPSLDAWATHTRPQQARSSPSADVWKGKIVLCGGSSRNDVEEYDPDKDQWTTWQVSLPAGMNYHTLLAVNDEF